MYKIHHNLWHKPTRYLSKKRFRFRSTNHIRRTQKRYTVLALIFTPLLDPINFHLKPSTDETVNAIADILRSYFRQLDRPLIPIEFHQQFYQICTFFSYLVNFDLAEVSDPFQKLSLYNDVIHQLPVVNFSTLKKLLDHLKEITDHSSTNLASVENLSKVFGPTIFCVDKVGVLGIV